MEIDGDLWVLTHMVNARCNAHYLHAWVVLEKDSLKPIKASMPFYFRNQGIEYCLGVYPTKNASELHCFASVLDRESWVGRFDVRELQKLLMPV